jgi:hypothetical protein
VILEWSQDSAFRFFPKVEHEEFGLMLHPIDLATNKVLALVGRREVRDYVDVVRCNEVLQPLGYLVWAAAGKDPGFSPLAVIEEAARSVRYRAVEIAALDYEGQPPDAVLLAQQWHAMVASARLVVGALPSEHAGTCVLTERGDLFREPPEALPVALARGAVRFHSGSIRGSLPQIISGQG